MSELSLPVIFEDADVVVINKPAGVVVNRSQTHALPTVQAWMQETGRVREATRDELTQLTPEDLEAFRERLGIGHRLDKDTSGVLISAKHPLALKNILSQFKQRTTHKQYVALVHGGFSVSAGEINLPIGRNSRDRLQFAVREDGRESVTGYQVMEKFGVVDLEAVRTLLVDRDDVKAKLQKISGLPQNFTRATKIYQGFSLLQLTPKTGRTHQIRVHLAHIKHPIVGDQVYAGKKRATLDHFWCPRHFLHASQLQLAHPISGEVLKLDALLPEDLQRVLKLLL